MSRLYEALKEASRRRGTNNSGNGLWDYWQKSGIDIPSADTDSDTPQAEQPVPPNGHSEEAGPEPLSVAEAASVTEQERAAEAVSALESDHFLSTVEEDAPTVPFKAESGARLDQNARLIPFALDSTVVEHYRLLRTKILQQQEAKPFRTLVVTSASPQEGKTVTVLNLGLSFATLPSFRVLVVDGDMRRGTLGSWLGMGNDQPGLSNLLDGSARLEDVVLKSDQVPMHFMLRGNGKMHDMHPSDFANHFQRLGEAFDLVLVDSPPANLLVDVQMLAANADAVLLVARAFSTSRKAFEKAVQELTPFRVLGAILNAGAPPHPRRYRGYY
jgi:capsular exopolysaccharide synthesis family protein